MCSRGCFTLASDDKAHPMTKHAQGIPLGAWLSDLPDEQLVRLLTLRPDLAQPAPASLAALAARAQARQSVQAATDELDLRHLAVLDALLVLHANRTTVTVADVAALLEHRIDADDLDTVLADLADRALVWGTDGIRVAAEAGAGLPWYPGQLALETPRRTAEDLAAALGALPEDQRELLSRLSEGSPVGRTRDAAPGAPADHPVPRLLAAGLLLRLDDETVLLPRRVGQLLRGHTPDPVLLAPPDPAVRRTAVADVDGAAAVAVLDLLRETESVLALLGATPVPQLRSGGLGVREVRRLAKTAEVTEAGLALILEIAAAAGLIADGMPDPEPESGSPPFWAPTAAADRFLDAPAAAQWAQLAGAWLTLASRPSLIGRRGPDGKPLGALSYPLHSAAAPLDRRLLLKTLAGLPPGTGTDAATVSAALIWARPRWAARLQPEPVGDLLDEAHALGVVAHGALSSPARALLDSGEDAAVTAMSEALPAPVDNFLLQADLTVVVPGPPARDLAVELAAVADRESAGAASVYRVTEATVRRALDSGRSAGELHAFFTGHTKTPVPQGLTYLIDDVARRHGRLRVGLGSSFVRCEDPALLAQAVASPALRSVEPRLLAPTVAISLAPIGELLAALRDAGFAPAAEDASGAVVDLAARGARVAGQTRRWSQRSPLTPPDPDGLAALVSVLRRVDATPEGENLDATQATMALLRAAIERSEVLIGYLDAAGMATRRVVAPISVRGGLLNAFDQASGRVREFAVHRITSVLSDPNG